jgi:hypothetical protein
MISFVEAMHDPQLLGPWFEPAASWAAWRAFSKALFGLPMTADEAETFRRHTNRQIIPDQPAKEAWLCVGRRGGKSIVAAAIAVFAAVFRDYAPYVKPGERPVVMVIAADKDQAQVVFDYIAAFFDGVPLLGGMVTQRTKNDLRLVNGVEIRVLACSFRRVRGRTVVAAILDECAFWYNDDTSRNPDREIVSALRPSMGTIPTSLLIAISSPYARRGVLWEAHKRYFGQDDRHVLVWQADTASMNPALDPRVIEEAYERDAVAARAEYGAQFREDLESFISQEVVERVVVTGRTTLPFERGKEHVAFCDPAGGSGQDSFTLAIARVEGKTAVLCRVDEWRPPFSPDVVTEHCVQILKEYALRKVTGDAYAKGWPAAAFREHGISYATENRTVSDLYALLLPLVNAGRVELLPHTRLVNQLLALERSTSRLGRDSITHPPGGHDDVINAAAGALVLANMVGERKRELARWDEDAPLGEESWRPESARDRAEREQREEEFPLLLARAIAKAKAIGKADDVKELERLDLERHPENDRERLFVELQDYVDAGTWRERLRNAGLWRG